MRITMLPHVNKRPFIHDDQFLGGGSEGVTLFCIVVAVNYT